MIFSLFNKNPIDELDDNSKKFISKLIFVILFLSSLIFQQLSAQGQTNEGNPGEVERILEEILEQVDSEEPDAEISELYQLVQDLLTHPLDLNNATLDEFLQIPNLSYRLAQNIINHRSEYGHFTAVQNLLDVAGIGPVTFERIRPFVTVEGERTRGVFNRGSWTQNSRFEGYARFRQVVQAQEGSLRPDSLGGFHGAPYSYYQRFYYRSRHLSMNVTQDKDPGEPLTYPAGFDYTSWHIAIQNRERLQTLIIGDYSVSFGQGLLLWSGGSFGKSSNTVGGLAKNERGVRPYTSAQESNGFRGMAITVGEQIQFTGFYSNRKRTASETRDGSVNFPTASGLHRTTNEINRRNNLGQLTYGGRVRVRFDLGYVGVTAFHNLFDRNIAAGVNPYQLGLFSGRERSGYAADFRLLLDRFQFFGETAYTDNGGVGSLIGVILRVDPRTNFAISYRNYDSHLQSLFGAAFGEQSGIPRNEIGFYVGLRHSLSSQLLIDGYIDLFRFPSPRFQTTQSTSGTDSLLRIEYQPNRSTNLYSLIRIKAREHEVTDYDRFGREFRALSHHVRANLRLHSEFEILHNLRLRLRFDLIRTKTALGEVYWGTLLFKDIRFRPFSNFRIDARITVFDADHFESRLYQFENDLLYVLSNTMLFDRGQRVYILFHYRPVNRFEVWFKASTTVYENRNVIGSGLNQITGNKRSNIGIQLRLRL